MYDPLLLAMARVKVADDASSTALKVDAPPSPSGTLSASCSKSIATTQCAPEVPRPLTYMPPAPGYAAAYAKAPLLQQSAAVVAH